MAVEGLLSGLFVGADHQVVYTDEDAVPTDMTGWTVKLDIRRRDTDTTALVSATGTVSGTYANTLAANTQKVTFLLPRAVLASTVFKGDDPTMRYSIVRTDAGFQQPLRYGDVPLIRVSQA